MPQSAKGALLGHCGDTRPRHEVDMLLRFSPNDVARFSSLGATNLIQK
jgi:hypothetical protein